MDTTDLVKALAADARRVPASLSSVWWGATGLAVVLAGLIFAVILGPRADFAAALETSRFLFKFALTLTLAGTALAAVRALSRPGEGWRKAVRYLAVAPILLATGVVADLMTFPPETWTARLVGTNSLVCLLYVPLIGIGPLAVFLLALRHGAPTRPALAGAVAGLLAGAVAATFYAAHCPDDSPLFVAAWYTTAIAVLAACGAAAASRLARW